MILPDLVLPSRCDQQWKYSGIDHIDHCVDKNHFESYPFHVQYDYNSRGFRDLEWPQSQDELRQCIWCVGDSFTVGIGQPKNHIWPHILQDRAGIRTINISMDGASNDWIARRAKDIANIIGPKNIVIMWSYVNRRESDCADQSDEDRRIAQAKVSNLEDHKNWLDNLVSLRNFSCNVIHTTIPNHTPDMPQQLISHWNDIKGDGWPQLPPLDSTALDALPQWIIKEMRSVHKCWHKFKSWLEQDADLVQIYRNHDLSDLIPIQQLDFARDGHHFDLATSEYLVCKILPRLRI